MTIDTPAREDQTLAATHRAMWALGDYALMAEEVMAPPARSWLPPRASGRVFGCSTSPLALAIFRCPQPRRVPRSFPPT